MSTIAELQKEVDRLNSSIKDAARVKKALEGNKADLQHYIKVAQQNLKYLKKPHITAAASEYSKIISAYREAIKQTAGFEKKLKVIESSIEKLMKKLKLQNTLLERARKLAEPKVLQFKRKKA